MSALGYMAKGVKIEGGVKVADELTLRWEEYTDPGGLNIGIRALIHGRGRQKGEKQRERMGGVSLMLLALKVKKWDHEPRTAGDV